MVGTQTTADLSSVGTQTTGVIDRFDFYIFKIMDFDYEILELEWDYQIIKDASGKKRKIIRGVDYDLDWIKLNEEFAKNGNTIFRFWDECFKILYKIIDIESFEVVESKESVHYFKDKNHVYIDSYMNVFSILENANPNTIKVLDIEKGLATSENTDYYYDQIIPFRLKDATIYEGDLYQKVGEQIYFNFREKVDCDAQTFQLVDNRECHKIVYKDKNYVYYKGKIVEDADPVTFHFIENCINEEQRLRYNNCDIHYYAKDKKYAYFVNSPFAIKRIKTKHLEEFNFKVIDSEGYAFDSEFVYHNGIRRKIDGFKTND